MTIRKNSGVKAAKQGGAIVSDKVGSYEKHPFFVKEKDGCQGIS